MTKLLKGGVFLGAAFLQSLPLTLSSTLFLLILGLWLYGLRPLTRSQALVTMGGLVLLKLGVIFVPSFPIQEGHNVVHPVGKVWPRPSQIPQNIRTCILEEFDKAYPKAQRCSKKIYGCWQNFTPKTQDFAWSADSLFQGKAPSRRVFHLSHSSLETARIGAINETTYNFYAYLSDVKRFQMPYYLFYAIPPELGGSRLVLQGLFFLETPEGFAQQVFKDPHTLEVAASGLRFYALKIAPDASLKVTLHKNFQAVVWDMLRIFLTRLLPFGLFAWILGRPSWQKLKIPLISVGSFFLACLILRPGLFTTYPILPGGGDGLVYEGYGRQILEALSQGNILEALRGVESIYYFMPGLRYIKALEKALFGESFLGLVCLVSFMGVALHQTLRHFMSEKGAFRLVIVFCVLPLFERFGFAAYLYVQKVYSGHGEPLAILLFFLGASSMMRAAQEQKESLTFWASFLFSLSAFIRPSYLMPIGCFTVVYFYHALVRADSGRKKLQAMVPYLGYAALLVMPFHNLYFGKSLFLTTSAAFHPVNLKVTLGDYALFFRELAAFNFSHVAVQKVLEHLDSWNGLSDSYRLLPLFYVVVTLLRQQTPLAVRALSAAALSSHLLMLFYIAVGRYAYLAWMMTLVVFFYEVEVRLYPQKIQPWLLKLRQNRAAKNPRS